MHTLRNWRAKRAGGRITVYGDDEKGHPAKIVGVDKIEPGVGKLGPIGRARTFAVATDKTGAEHTLLI